MIQFKLEALHLRGNHYAVRPEGKCGTMGWTPYHWTVIYVNARNEHDARVKAWPQVIQQLRAWRRAA